MASTEIQDAIKNAIAASLGDIVAQTTEAVKRSLQDKVEDVVEKKVKQEELPTFKRKFNEDHFKHSKDVEKIMDRIMANLDDQKVDEAKQQVEKGKKLLRKRQKLIKIADREDDGWEVIRCYQSDALASDSDDEKRLDKSRRQAKRNKKESRSKRLNYAKKRCDTNNFKDFSKTFNSRMHKDIVCYFCGREGHMQYSCPSKRSDSRDVRDFDFEMKCKGNKSVVGRLKNSSFFLEK